MLEVSENSEKKKKIDSLIINLITTDLQPLSIVEDSAFTALMKFLGPKYQLSSSKLLKTRISNKYENVKNNNVEHELNNYRKYRKYRT